MSIVIILDTPPALLFQQHSAKSQEPESPNEVKTSKKKLIGTSQGEVKVNPKNWSNKACARVFIPQFKTPSRVHWALLNCNVMVGSP